jgi:D-alanyl-D-alanine carboxypeptidase
LANRSAPESGLLSADRQARIDAVAEAAIAEQRTPGLSIAVARDGQIVFAKGYGQANLETATAVTPDSVFRIGSITKQFTAAATLLLADRGLLNLDDAVSKHLPEFPEAHRFTIRQMLDNTSGLANFQEAPSFAVYTRGVRSPLDMAAYIAGLKPLLEFPPGSRWRYSSSGHYLAGLIVERLSGLSFGDFLQTCICAPLRMAHTALDHDGDVVPGRAAGYDKSLGAASGYANASYASMTVPGAAGGLRSTPADLVLWHAALLGGELLTSASLAEMVRPARLSDGSLAIADKALSTETLPDAHYGPGLFLRRIDGRHSIGHAGAINGFSCFHESFPDFGMQLLVLANCNATGLLLQLPLTRALFGGEGTITPHTHS